MTQTQKDALAEPEPWAIAAREMRTRDADAAIYDDFFTGFQTAVEFGAYRHGLAGAAVGPGLDLACGNGRTMGLLSSNALVGDRKSTRLNSSHIQKSRMPSSA